MIINYLKKYIKLYYRKAKNTNKAFNHNFDHIKDINIINKGLENEK